MINPDELLKYGEFLTDDEATIVKWDIKGNLYIAMHIRIRIIKYKGYVYYHKYGNGELLECKMLG